MKKYKPKTCIVCGIDYTPTGNCSKYCKQCSEIKAKESRERGAEAFRRRQGMRVGRGARPEKENNMYIHGQCVFRRWAKELKNSDKGFCGDCGKDLRHATHYEWVGHHKDHNRMNNTKENLKLLCKKCHQLEHQCWKAFEGVTTISKESRVDNNSKRLTPEKDDDIVCSV